MFDRFFMYWLLWLLVIIVFFFMKQGIKRTAVTVWLLTIISLSSVYASVGNIQISLSMLLILFGAFIYIVENSFSLLKLLRAFTLMIAYCAILIWELVAPVWFFISSYFMIPVLIVFVAMFLSRRMDDIFAYLLLGVSFGQLLFDLLISSYSLHYEVGMTNYFIHLSLAILLVITVRTCLVLWSHISNFLEGKLT